MKSVAQRFEFRKLRVRKKIFGTAERPRVSVFRSLKNIHAQIIDDVKGVTLLSVSSLQKGFENGNGVKKANLVGQALAKKALEKGIEKVVFDRGGRVYHGRVKALADGAREAGLKF
ncbi:MAG: 50S ribosomal protein L18 [Elusimicrobiota bacterium]